MVRWGRTVSHIWAGKGEVIHKRAGKGGVNCDWVRQYGVVQVQGVSDRRRSRNTIFLFHNKKLAWEQL